MHPSLESRRKTLSYHLSRPQPPPPTPTPTPQPNTTNKPPAGRCSHLASHSDTLLSVEPLTMRGPADSMEVIIMAWALRQPQHAQHVQHQRSAACTARAQSSMRPCGPSRQQATCRQAGRRQRGGHATAAGAASKQRGSGRGGRTWCGPLRLGTRKRRHAAAPAGPTAASRRPCRLQEKGTLRAVIREGTVAGRECQDEPRRVWKEAERANRSALGKKAGKDSGRPGRAGANGAEAASTAPLARPPNGSTRTAPARISKAMPEDVRWASWCMHAAQPN
jgi:hypothetical protein